MAATRETCIVHDCQRKPEVRERYDRPLVFEGGDVDEVCGAHTDRFGGKYPMIAREVLPGAVPYQMGSSV